MKSFRRPSDLEFPIIYHKFKVKDLDSDDIIEYQIQDLLEEDYEKAVELMTTDYSPEESFSRCRGIPDDPDAMAEVQKIWHLCLQTKISVGCYKSDGSGELIGTNILLVYDKNDEPVDVNMIKTQHFRDLLTLLKFIEGNYDVYEKYGTDKYLSDFGLVTKKSYRHRGIGTEFLKARVSILKALKVDVTSTVFTVIGSQKAAVKANYEEIVAIKWTDIAADFPQFDFTKADSEYCKILDMKLDKEV